MAEDITRRDRPARSSSPIPVERELTPEQKLAEIYAEANALSKATIGAIDFGDAPRKDEPDQDVSEVQVPEIAHEQFYAKWHTAIKRLVPHPEMRRRIYKEGGIFLKEGRRRKADSRMARPSRRLALNEVVAEWIRDHNGLNPSELHRRLVQLNLNTRPNLASTPH